MELNIGDRIWLIKQLWLSEPFDYYNSKPVLYEVIQKISKGFHQLKNLETGYILFYGEIYEPKWKKLYINLFE